MSKLWNFVGRGDVFAEQSKDGRYFPVRRPINDGDLEEHEAGIVSYGTYVIDPMNQGVQWAVFDLDTYDEEALDLLCAAVATLVLNVGGDESCLLLENSGGKGYHIWLLLSEAVPAAKVRPWVEQVRSAYVQANPGDWPALEIFPKQDSVVEGGFGNLVKLPLGIHAKSGNRSQFVVTQGWASGVDSVCRLDVSLIPDAPVKEASEGPSGVLSPFPCISKLITEGAPQGNRDNGMYHFCRYAHSAGLPDDLVEEWAERVNQGFNPPLSDTEVAVKVRSACSATESKHSCNAEWLQGFCPGGDQCHAPWNTERVGKVSEAPVASYMDMTPEQRREARQRGRV